MRAYPPDLWAPASKKGTWGEAHLAPYLNEAFPGMKHLRPKFDYGYDWMDFYHEATGMRLEVKNDIRSGDTGNIMLETHHCAGREWTVRAQFAGIFKNVGYEAFLEEVTKPMVEVRIVYLDDISGEWAPERSENARKGYLVYRQQDMVRYVANHHWALDDRPEVPGSSPLTYGLLLNAFFLGQDDCPVKVCSTPEDTMEVLAELDSSAGEAATWSNQDLHDILQTCGFGSHRFHRTDLTQYPGPRLGTTFKDED